jgi:hypothetical protein
MLPYKDAQNVTWLIITYIYSVYIEILVRILSCDHMMSPWIWAIFNLDIAWSVIRVFVPFYHNVGHTYIYELKFLLVINM